MGTSIRDRMQVDLLVAMQSRETLTVSVLRSTLAAVANAEAVDRAGIDRHVTETARKHLTEEDLHRIVSAERDDLRSASSEMESIGQAGKAEELSRQAAILELYMA